MKNKKNDDIQKKVNEKEIKNTQISGKKFEDLDDEEMEKYQGSGDDVRGEDLTAIFNLTSKNGYKC